MIPAKNQINIPIEELRARAHELPKDKELIVFCILSTRGFEGQLILNQAGYDNVKFVQGGVQFWPCLLYTSKTRCHLLNRQFLYLFAQ